MINGLLMFVELVSMLVALMALLDHQPESVCASMVVAIYLRLLRKLQ